MSTSNRPGVRRPQTPWPWVHLRITTTAVGRSRLVMGLTLLLVLASVIVVRRPHASPVLATVTLGQDTFIFEDIGVALDTRTGRAFIGSDDEGRVYVLDTIRGALLHTDTVVSSAHRLPICHVIVLDEQTGRAFVCNGGSVSMIDAASGRLLSAIPLPGATGHWLAVDPRSRHLFVFSNSMPFEAVSVLDAGSGRLLRRLVLGEPSAQSIQSTSLPNGISPLAVDPRDARVFVGHFFSNRLSVLDARSGQLVRTVTVGLQPVGSTITVHGPIVDERTRRVFVGDADSGTVTTLDAVSGQIVRTVRVGPSLPALVVDTRTGRIVAFTARGVSVLDAMSGRLLHTTRLDLVALANPVVDERTGTVFALDFAHQGVDMFDGTRGRLLRTVLVAATPVAWPWTRLAPTRDRGWPQMVRNTLSQPHRGAGTSRFRDTSPGRRSHWPSASLTIWTCDG
jgi:YVTN family beta-propeller protein